MSDLLRRPDESQFDYHKRLVYGKLVDKTLADYDYTEIGECVYGQTYATHCENSQTKITEVSRLARNRL